jgi:hypothetical protein
MTVSRHLRVSEQERFWAKVQKGDGCWLWTGGKFRRGYGAFKRRGPDGRFQQQKAHRVSYEWLVGPVPDGLCVLHTCDNPPCVNPAHLFLGTNLDNSEDRRVKGRSRNGYMGQTHCKHGHPLNEGNYSLRRRADGGYTRACKGCQRMRYRIRRAATVQVIA